MWLNVRVGHRYVGKTSWKAENEWTRELRKEKWWRLLRQQCISAPSNVTSSFGFRGLWKGRLCHGEVVTLMRFSIKETYTGYLRRRLYPRWSNNDTSYCKEFLWHTQGTSGSYDCTTLTDLMILFIRYAVFVSILIETCPTCSRFSWLCSYVWNVIEQLTVNYWETLNRRIIGPHLGEHYLRSLLYELLKTLFMKVRRDRNVCIIAKLWCWARADLLFSILTTDKKRVTWKMSPLEKSHKESLPSSDAPHSSTERFSAFELQQAAISSNNKNKKKGLLNPLYATFPALKN